MKRDIQDSYEHADYVKVLLMLVVAFLGASTLSLLDDSGHVKYGVLLVCGGLFLGALGYLHQKRVFGLLYWVLIVTEIGAAGIVVQGVSPWMFVGFLMIIMLLSLIYGMTLTKNK